MNVLKYLIPFSFVLLLLIISEKALAVVKKLPASYCSEQKCGLVSIHYPFGIGSDCYYNQNFSIYCDNSSDPPKPFMESANLEVLSISIQNSTVKVNNHVLASCTDQGSSRGDPVVEIELSNGPFSYAGASNRFTAVGCDILALLTNEDGGNGGGKGASIAGGCVSYCNGGVQNASRGGIGCFGVDCCQTTNPWDLKFLSMSFKSMDTGERRRISTSTANDDQQKCDYAFMVDNMWFELNLKGNISAIERYPYVPATLEWVIDEEETNIIINNTLDICGDSAHSVKRNISSPTTSKQGYICVCNDGYENNPYLYCTDIDECKTGEFNCAKGMLCKNTQGAYNCTCRFGSDEDGDSCYPIPYEYIWILALSVQGGGLMFLLGCLWLLHKVFKTRKDNNLKKMYFKRNGGVLLQELLSSSEDTVKKTELFSSKELEKATDDYNKNRILGKGGQGTVYKGMLTDGKIIAVKKSKPILHPCKAKEFINEVVILSKINHRNIVKILGCCLETEFPMLVYEFIPNGTLFQYIQDDDKDFPFSWDMRLQIATEVAAALSYLHSAASTPIYHRDIKSTNILLDERFRAKVADFGISMSIPDSDQTHITTMVRGTFGYLDPEYFRTNKFTEKSDAYSFGVILAEFLTGLGPILSRTSQEGIGLASHFVTSMEHNRFFNIVDTRIIKEAKKSEIIAVGNLARRCLNLNGKKRPTMKAVAMELERIKMSRETPRVNTIIPSSLRSPACMLQFRQKLPWTLA